jgi:hypothetical protein
MLFMVSTEENGPLSDCSGVGVRLPAGVSVGVRVRAGVKERVGRGVRVLVGVKVAVLVGVRVMVGVRVAVAVSSVAGVPVRLGVMRVSAGLAEGFCPQPATTSKVRVVKTNRARLRNLLFLMTFVLVDRRNWRGWLIVL